MKGPTDLEEQGYASESILAVKTSSEKILNYCTREFQLQRLGSGLKLHLDVFIKRFGVMMINAEQKNILHSFPIGRFKIIQSDGLVSVQPRDPSFDLSNCFGQEFFPGSLSASNDPLIDLRSFLAERIGKGRIGYQLKKYPIFFG